MFSASTTELYFPKPHNRVITNTIKFTNNTTIDAVVKMRTTSREKFHVRPRIFAIRKGETIEVSVSSRVLPSDIPEIDKSDECHAVIHQFSGKTSSSSSSDQQNLLLTPEGLQLAWDAGSNLGRVVLHCHQSEPPANHKLVFSSATPLSRHVSKSPSIPRNTSDATLAYNNNVPKHSRVVSDMSIGSQNGGKPPLSATNSAHGNFNKDSEVQQYLRNNSGGSNNSENNSGSMMNGAALEKFSEKVHQHENALHRNVQQLGQLSSTAKVAAQNVKAQVLAREEKKQQQQNGSEGEDKIMSKTGKIKRVPLSVAIFFMVLAFLAGVLMKQSAYQHHLDTSASIAAGGRGGGDL